MPLSINTNVASLTAQRAMINSNAGLESAFERLSTGKRINSAADDAAGLAIGKDLESRVSGLNQAIRNANDAISMVQIAEGSLDEATTILQRMRDLSVQAANGSLSSAEQGEQDTEHEKLAATLDKIVGQASFNGISLLTSSDVTKTFQTGADASDITSVTFEKVGDTLLGIDKDTINLTGTSSAAETAPFSSFALGKTSVDFGAVTSGTLTATDTIAIKIDGTTYTAAVQNGATITGTGAAIAAFLNDDANYAGTNLSTVGVMNYTGSTLTFVYSNVSDVHAGGLNGFTFTDTDSSGNSTSVVTAAPTAVAGQAVGDVFTLTVGGVTYATDAATAATDFNTNKKIASALNTKLVTAGVDFSIATAGGTDNGDITITYGNKGDQTLNNSEYKLEKTTGNDGDGGSDATSAAQTDGLADASGAITIIDKALALVADDRARLGATQAQLESTVRNLANVAENTSAAAGRSMDTDYAAETANLTKAQILPQAATSVLAQANAQPQSVLSLLQ